MGATTAGRLSEITGLTSGAVTRVIDRLEQAGYVRRVPDPADRRRVIVEVVPEKVADVQVDPRPGRRARPPRRSATTPTTSSPLITDFLTRMEPITREEAARAARDPADEAPRPAGRLGAQPRRSAA